MLIDTHTHLYLPDFEVPDDAVRRALAAGVGHMLFPNVDLTTVEPMLALAEAFPGHTSVALGLHPTEVDGRWEEALERLQPYWSRAVYVAVGEIGIDLYWDKTFRDQQMQAFARQVALAREKCLPVIIHCREGLGEVLEVLQDYRDVPAVFHSFGGTVAEVERIRGLGDYFFGINGIVTFKNSRLRDVLPDIGIGRILLETDSPYLAPVPHRGKRNESAYITATAAHVAQALGMTAEAVASATTANACSLFKLSY